MPSHRIATRNFATLLNGVDQYWSKANPVNMNLNGSEIITNGNMEDGFTSGIANGWSKVSTADPEWTCTDDAVDFHSGAHSQKIEFTLPAGGRGFRQNARTVVEGCKYTLEFWYKLTLTAGSNLAPMLNFNMSPASPPAMIADGTWRKYVFNFLVSTSATDYIDIPRFAAGQHSGTLNIDDVSLTQAYDAMIVTRTKSNVNTGSLALIGTRASATDFFELCQLSGNWRALIIASTGNNVNMDNAGIIVLPNIDVLPILLIDRTGNMSFYCNGVAGNTAAISTIGKVASVQTFYIGSRTGGSYWNGQVSETQIIRFTSFPSNITSIIAQISAQKKPLSAYPNGTIVGWWDWKNGGQDLSGNMNHLIPVGASPIVRA